VSVWEKWNDPRLFIAVLVVALFAWAYGSNTGDQTMIGALIGAFNLAIGYYLGSSRSAEASNSRTDKLIEIQHANATGPTGNPGDPVHTVDEAKP
jgi:hypothetical protein